MANHKAKKIISETGPINERYDRSEVRAIECHDIQGADAQHRAEGKCIEGNANVIGEDLTRSDLVRFVGRFPPMPMSFDVLSPPKRVDPGEFREIRVVARARESDCPEQKKDPESRGCVTPGASKRLREIPGNEVAEPPPALRVSPVNTAMSTNYQAIQIVNQTRVARFCASNRQVGSSPPVDAAQLSHFFAMQTPQRHVIEACQQFLELLPDGLALFNETIDGHELNFRFQISDFRFRLNADLSLKEHRSQIANQKSEIKDRLVECVPNFSEGRKGKTVERIVRAIESVKAATVLNRHLDADHNRSVITFVARPELVVDAALRAVSTAAELIDLREHTGQHPRIGATDVLPFIPVSGVTMDECIALAHDAGRRIWQELSIPVYFYERAALRPDRVRLENVRGQGFEQLREEIGKNPDRAPDVGEPKLHQSAGGIAVGARPFLIAFNVNLLSSDLSIARRIARAVRERDGGLRFVKALGFELQSRGLVQVSMNLIDYEQTTIARAFAAVHREASRLGVTVSGAEIVGLLPRTALDRGAAYFPLLENFRETLVLETLLESIASSRE